METQYHSKDPITVPDFTVEGPSATVGSSSAIPAAWCQTWERPLATAGSSCYTCCMMPDWRGTSRHCWILLLYLLHDTRLKRNFPPLLDPLAIPAAWCQTWEGPPATAGSSCYTCFMMPDLRVTSRHFWILLLYLLHDARLKSNIPPLLDPPLLYLLHDARLKRDLPPLMDPLAIPAAWCQTWGRPLATVGSSWYTCCMMPDLRVTSRNVDPPVIPAAWCPPLLDPPLLYLLHDARL